MPFTRGVHILGSTDDLAALIIWLTTLAILIKIVGWGLRVGATGSSLIRTVIGTVAMVKTVGAIAGAARPAAVDDAVPGQ